MKWVYQVKNEKLKQLHREEKIISSEFQSFRIRHCANINRISSDILYGAIPIQDLYVKDELVSRTTPKFIDGHCKISLMCVCFLVIKVVSLMTMCFFQYYNKCVPTM